MNLNIKSDSRIEILIENYNSLIKEEVVYDLENTLNKTYEYDIIDYDTCNRKIEIIENNTKNSCFKTDIETNFFISVIFASEMSEQGNKKPYSFTETDNLSLKKILTMKTILSTSPKLIRMLKTILIILII